MIAYRILARLLLQKTSLVEKVNVERDKDILDCEMVIVTDHKGNTWYEPVERIIFNPKIIKEWNTGHIYEIDLTEGDNASERL